MVDPSKTLLLLTFNPYSPVQPVAERPFTFEMEFDDFSKDRLRRMIFDASKANVRISSFPFRGTSLWG